MLVTVNEFSIKTGIKKNKVYSMIDSELKEFVTRNNGIIYIDIDKYRISISDSIEIEKNRKNVNDSGKAEETVFYSSNNELQEENNRLKMEINRLEAELTEQRKANIEKDNRIFELIDSIVEITRNTQVLVARTQEQQNLLLKSAEKTDKPSNKKGILGWIKRKRLQD